MRHILFIIFMILILTSCENKITDAFAYSGILEVSESEMNFKAAAYSKTIEVKGVMDWDIDTNHIDPWCKVMAVKNYGGKEYVTAFVDSNSLAINRETKFYVVSEEQRIVIDITQIGNIPQVLFSIDSLTIGLEPNVLLVDFVTNIEYELSLNADWFQVKDVDYEGDRRLRISVLENKSGAERQGEIKFTHKDGIEEWIWTFRQLNKEGTYSAQGVGKLDPNLRVLPSSAKASSESEGKGIEKSYDGENVTHYQSLFQKESEPVELVYNFDGTSTIDYISYLPYAGDISKSFKTTQIWVEQEDGEYKYLKTVDFRNSGEQIVTLATSIESPKSIKFVVTSSYDNEEGLLVVACAEMGFYSADTRYPDIFADPVYSRLHDDVTLDKIFEMEDVLFRNIAYHLYNNTYDAGRIINCNSYLDVTKYPLSFRSYGGLDNVTGITVKAQEEIPIFANKIGDDEVYATILNPENINEIKKYRLFDGVNKIKANFDGHIYISFISDEEKNVDIHVAGGNYNGYLDLSKDLDYNLLNAAKSSYIDIIGNHSQLLFKKEHLQDKDIVSLVATYDEIVHSQHLFMGLEKYGLKFDNRILFLETSKSFDISFRSYFIECPEIMIDKLTDIQQIKGDILWDLALAVGTIHKHNCLLFDGVIFTTPKLFALATELAFNEPLSIDANNWYSDGFKSILIPEEKLADLPDKDGEIPGKITPFWQLQLYASEVLGEEDFYKDVLFQLRALGNMPERERMFISVVQNRLKLNMTTYFKKWGFNTRGVYAGNYKKAPEGLIYLTSNNVEEFKKEEGVTPSAYGYFVAGKKVTVYFPQNVVAYTVRHSVVDMQVFIEDSFIVNDWKDSMKIYAVGADGTEVEIRRF